MSSRSIGLSALTFATLALPVIAAAQNRIGDILFLFQGLLNMIIGLLVAVAIVVFFWGLIMYLVSVGEEKAKGLQIMLYGILAIFVMVSIWGIIGLLQRTFNVGTTQPVQPPRVEKVIN